MATTTQQPIAYKRIEPFGQIIVCVPCSDDEDRENPYTPRKGARCGICREPIFDNE